MFCHSTANQPNERWSGGRLFFDPDSKVDSFFIQQILASLLLPLAGLFLMFAFLTFGLVLGVLTSAIVGFKVEETVPGAVTCGVFSLIVPGLLFLIFVLLPQIYSNQSLAEVLTPFGHTEGAGLLFLMLTFPFYTTLAFVGGEYAAVRRRNSLP